MPWLDAYLYTMQEQISSLFRPAIDDEIVNNKQRNNILKATTGETTLYPKSARII
jgi:hypothetical protein